MKAYEKIETLIETVINGNNINSCNTYKNMIKSITINDIKSYCSMMDICCSGATKIELIKNIAKG